MYFSYDYIHIRREQAELKRLKQQTAEQKKQIEGLVDKVDQFAFKMEELKQFDKKIRIMANLESRRDREQLLGIGGPVSEEKRLRSQMAADDKAMIAGVGKQVDRLMDDASSREQSFTALLAFLKEKKSLLAATPSVWPVMGWVTSEFGRRTNPFGNEREFHKGIDIATEYGRAIQAPADGIVDGSVLPAGCGADDPDRSRTRYFHILWPSLQGDCTSPARRSERGDRIGYVGNSGRSTGSHLHYAVMLNGVPVNPRKYLN